jgi:predicted nucleic acid-binding protein
VTARRDAVLVDSSVWIDLFAAQDTPEAAWLVKASESGLDALAPGIVVCEVLRGVRSEPKARELAALFAQLVPAPEPDSPDYVGAAALYRACRARGITLQSTIDCLIAQLCIRHRLALLTTDQVFLAISETTGLALVRTR